MFLRGKYYFLSNFYPHPFYSPSLGVELPTLEHGIQLVKTSDPASRAAILAESSPGAVKRLGRRVPLRSDWEDVKIDLMRELLREKFATEPLRSKLLDTPAELSEGNTWHDQFWGDCSCEKHAETPGRNVLGELLMEVREEISR